MSKNTTIMITKTTKKVLAAFGKKGDTYEKIIKTLIGKGRKRG